MNIEIILKVKGEKMIIYHQDGSHHQPGVSAAAFYGVTVYSWDLIWGFLCFCF